MTDKAYVAGVGMVPFQKPGKSESYDVMAAEAPAPPWPMPGWIMTRCSRPMSATSMATALADSDPFIMSA